MGNKPWGNERILESNDRYAVKLITYDRQARTSLQLHKRKRETLYVIDGAIIVEVDGLARTMMSGTHITIEPGQVHRVTGGRQRGGVVIECQSPELDDIVRLEDDHGRPTGAG
jgi:mannose-6-phosphate isomerase